MNLPTTSSQTIGPYLHIGLTWLVTADLTGPGISGDVVTIEGRVFDADGAPVDDMVIEFWQANAHGRYAHPEDTQDKPLEPGWRGFGRVMTDESGVFRFKTIKPGRVPGPAGALQAPHLNVTLMARGLLKQLITRMYFPDDAANAHDPVLQRVPEARRDTLIARADAANAGTLTWNVVLNGRDETVFFAW
jgi:protocatechuate 3,4-dioxygenase alpha subunit